MERLGILFAAAALGAAAGGSTWEDRKRMRGNVAPVCLSQRLTAGMPRLGVAKQ